MKRAGFEVGQPWFASLPHGLQAVRPWTSRLTCQSHLLSLSLLICQMRIMIDYLVSVLRT